MIHSDDIDKEKINVDEFLSKLTYDNFINVFPYYLFGQCLYIKYKHIHASCCNGKHRIIDILTIDVHDYYTEQEILFKIELNTFNKKFKNILNE